VGVPPVLSRPADDDSGVRRWTPANAQEDRLGREEVDTGEHTGRLRPADDRGGAWREAGERTGRLRSVDEGGSSAGGRRARWLAMGEPTATSGCGHVGVDKAGRRMTGGVKK
jgi:hypothetical protein